MPNKITITAYMHTDKNKPNTHTYTLTYIHNLSKENKVQDMF